MSEFSTLLGCNAATHFYHSNSPDGAFYNLSTTSVSGGADIILEGNAPCTLTILPSADVGEEHAIVQVAVRSNDISALQDVTVEESRSTRGLDEDASASGSWLKLRSPLSFAEELCMRYDLSMSQ